MNRPIDACVFGAPKPAGHRPVSAHTQLNRVQSSPAVTAISAGEDLAGAGANIGPEGLEGLSRYFLT